MTKVCLGTWTSFVNVLYGYKGNLQSHNHWRITGCQSYPRSCNRVTQTYMHRQHSSAHMHTHAITHNIPHTPTHSLLYHFLFVSGSFPSAPPHHSLSLVPSLLDTHEQIDAGLYVPRHIHNWYIPGFNKSDNHITERETARSLEAKKNINNESKKTDREKVIWPAQDTL